MTTYSILVIIDNQLFQTDLPLLSVKQKYECNIKKFAYYMYGREKVPWAAYRMVVGRMPRIIVIFVPVSRDTDFSSFKCDALSVNVN